MNSQCGVKDHLKDETFVTLQNYNFHQTRSGHSLNLPFEIKNEATPASPIPFLPKIFFTSVLCFCKK